MAIVFKGGVIAAASGSYRADLRVDGERIDSIGFDITRPGDEIIDASRYLLLPGMIDVHTHFNLPFSDEIRSSDDFASGSRAALMGGTTTVIDYATQFKGETLRQGLDNWMAMASAQGTYCDYGFHLAITDWNDAVREEIGALVAAGVTSFKAYMAYKGKLQLSDEDLYELMKELTVHGALLCVHCENGDVIAARTRKLLAEGRKSASYHPVSRPEQLETEAANRLLTMAELLGASVYVVHVSAAATLQVIERARTKGVSVFAETCPHYLWYSDHLYGGDEAPLYVCAPPLRSSYNHAPLWLALQEGRIDVVASDHCPFTREQKERAAAIDFSCIPGGLSGVGERVMHLYRGVRLNMLSMERMVAALATEPAKLFGLYPRKGALIPGADADILLLDPSSSPLAAEQDPANDVPACCYGSASGQIAQVYLRGKRVLAEGRFLAEEPEGRFIPRHI